MGPDSAGRPVWRHAKSPLQKRGPAPQQNAETARRDAPRGAESLACQKDGSRFTARRPPRFVRGKRRPAPGFGEQPSGAFAPRERWRLPA